MSTRVSLAHGCGLTGTLTATIPTNRPYLVSASGDMSLVPPGAGLMSSSGIISQMQLTLRNASAAFLRCARTAHSTRTSATARAITLRSIWK